MARQPSYGSLLIRDCHLPIYMQDVAPKIAQAVGCREDGLQSSYFRHLPPTLRGRCRLVKLLLFGLVEVIK